MKISSRLSINLKMSLSAPPLFPVSYKTLQVMFDDFCETPMEYVGTLLSGLLSCKIR